jgi:HD superfamily phosphohydrolase
MTEIWKEIKIQPEDVAKLSVGPKYFQNKPFKEWESILSEIIIGDTLGVDRIDYLLRDSHHCGVAYGKFDHHRLIDTIRILPKEYTETKEPALGIEVGGLHAAESMLLARYFMYTQLYFHPVRRIYDKHLIDFLSMHLEDGRYPIDAESHLSITDCEMMAELFKAAKDNSIRGHDPARRIISREHFRLLYERNSDDLKINADAAKIICGKLCEKYGKDNVYHDYYRQKGEGYDFPVLYDDKRIVSSIGLSDVLAKMPLIATDYIYISLKYKKDAQTAE